MTDTVTMRFTNHDAVDHQMKQCTSIDEMVVQKDACPKIAKWYGGYHAGDNYTLEIDGVEQTLSINGEMTD